MFKVIYLTNKKVSICFMSKTFLRIPSATIQQIQPTTQKHNLQRGATDAARSESASFVFNQAQSNFCANQGQTRPEKSRPRVRQPRICILIWTRRQFCGSKMDQNRLSLAPSRPTGVSLSAAATHAPPN
jgi:hypothetical protein